MATQSTNHSILTTTPWANSELLVQAGVVSSKWPALFAVMLGAVILFGVGFSNLSVAHNAAHNTRHAMVFPCH